MNAIVNPGLVQGPLVMGVQGNLLELYDLDGTLTTPSFESAEGTSYLENAGRFISDRIPSFSDRRDFVVEKLRQTITNVAHPFRHQHRFWAEFPTVQGRVAKVCPSVDHYLLTQFGARLFLENEMAEADRGSLLATQIGVFLGDPQWINAMYGFAAEQSLPHARMDDDARGVLEDRLAKGALMAIFTNSSLQKARQVAIQGGFEKYLVENGVERGKLGLVGNGKKMLVDESWSEVDQPQETRWGSQVDVSSFFEEETVVDLRRRAFYERVAELMTTSGASRLWMVGDVPSLELLPVANWLAFHPTVVMRETPMSADQERRMARELIGARVVSTLSEAVSDLG